MCMHEKGVIFIGRGIGHIIRMARVYLDRGNDTLVIKTITSYHCQYRLINDNNLFKSKTCWNPQRRKVASSLWRHMTPLQTGIMCYQTELNNTPERPGWPNNWYHNHNTLEQGTPQTCEYSQWTAPYVLDKSYSWSHFNAPNLYATFQISKIDIDLSWGKGENAHFWQNI